MKYNLTRICIALCGAGMFAFGIMRDETSQVFRKAILVCLECIGIG